MKTSAIMLFVLLTSGTSASFVALAAPPPAIDRGILLFEQGRLDSARACFEQWRAHTPRSDTAHFYLGRIAFKRSDFEQALSFFQRAAKLAPKTSAYHQWLGMTYGQLAIAVPIYKKPLFAGKIRSAFARAIELDPQNVDARLGLLQYYLVAPGVFGGSVPQAQRQAEAIGQVSSLHHALARGMIYQHQNAHPEAERAFREAIQDSIPSVAAFACARLESLYRDNSELDKAIALYEDLRRRQINDHRIYARLGYLYREIERYDEAIDAFATLATATPDALLPHLELARTALYGDRHFESATARLQAFLQRRSDLDAAERAEAYYLLAGLHHRQGDTAGARRLYQRALDLGYQPARDALRLIDARP